MWSTGIPRTSWSSGWGSDVRLLLEGFSLTTPNPDLLFWSDVSVQRRGANLIKGFISGCWSEEVCSFSVTLRLLHAVRLGLLPFVIPCGDFISQHPSPVLQKDTGQWWEGLFCDFVLRGLPPPLSVVLGAFSVASFHEGVMWLWFL